MAKPLTEEEFADYFVDVFNCIEKKFPNIQKLVIANTNPVFKSRVFGGGGSRDVDNRPLSYRGTSPRRGAYSKSYADKRRKKGRQIRAVDLQFSDRLFKSIQPLRRGKKFVYGFRRGGRSDSSRTNLEIANFITRRYGVDIFAISDKEAKAILKASQKEILRIVSKCF